MASAVHPTQSQSGAPRPKGARYVWELPIRIIHWVNALAIFILIATGLYIANPVLMQSGEAYRVFLMGRIIGLHYIAAFVMTCCVAGRMYWFFMGNNYARSGVPMPWKLSWYKAVIHQIREYMGIARGPVNIGHNSLAGAGYTGFFAMCGFEMLTGFALFGESNPGGFWDKLLGWSVPLLGGSFRVHMWHHLVAWFIVVFVLFHIYIVIYDSILYRDGLIDSIVAGPKFYEEGDIDADKWVS